MGKQIFDSSRKLLSVLLLLIFVLTLTAEFVCAQSSDAGITPTASPGGKCRLICEHWYQEKYCDHWNPGHSPTQWTCDHWSTRNTCRLWVKVCT